MSDDGILKSLWNLVPNFADAFRGDTHALIVVIFFVVIVAIASVAIWYTVRASRAANKALDALNEQLVDVSSENLLQRRSELLEQAGAAAPGVVGELWREFDETLVVHHDPVLRQDAIRNTVEADHYFSAERIAPQLVNNRLLTAAPAVLTALGLLGTFIGLATGLNSLKLGESATVEEMRAGIEGLVAGAGLGFTASVWGVLASLVVNIWEKVVERRVAARAAAFQARIDGLFVLHSPERSLLQVEKNTHDSAIALNELHEKIGTQLQEAVAGISQEMQDALTRAIETSMAPSMASLAESTATQSAEVFEKLVDKFADAFQSIGTRQAEQLGAASSTLDATVTAVTQRVDSSVAGLSDAFEAVGARQAEQLDAATATLDSALGSVSDKVGGAIVLLKESAAAQSTATSEQAEAFREQLTELSELTARQARLLDGSLSAITLGLDSAATKMGTATTSLDTSSTTLQGTARTFARTSERFESSLNAGAQALEGTAEAHAQAAAALSNHTTALEEINSASLDATERLTQAARAAGTSFETMQVHQGRFLNDLKAQVDNHSASLRNWLDEYSDQVQHQTTERMSDWNKHTHTFSSQMLEATNALSEVIDEMGVKIGAQDAGKSSLS
ncbi:anti-phage ZorAB system protein ZorA [Oerskovia merdavium]|uniref:Anti-phage defense ZorAB system ZorA n=1 Tax=Oerskovia merdavium TaxID=2762227 RepID=A0ABR8TZ80_9CELL|nr:anti-phage ZorAB system protein ZorA [Oerskovia merdavium]MBD7981098.1 anti-phage defense ZorAB system ZorA [Oerskovia merdavium]